MPTWTREMASADSTQIQELSRCTDDGEPSAKKSKILREETYMYSWKLERFSSLVGNVRALESPPFSKRRGTLKWCLRLYPSRRGEEDKGSVSCLLRLKDTQEDEEVTDGSCTFVFRNSNNSKLYTEDCEFDESSGTFFWEEICPTNKLLRRISKDDILLVRVRLRVSIRERRCAPTQVAAASSNASNQENPKLQRLSKLALDLGKMFVNGQLADVKFVVEGQTISAHRPILSCRSPVFASMFQKEPAGGSTTITIDDLGYNAMRSFLLFLYTGTAQSYRAGVTESLLKVSVRFAVQDLMTACEEQLAENTDRHNVLEMLVLADECGAAKLKEKALTCFYENRLRFQNRELFGRIVKERPSVLKDILQKLAAVP